MKWMAVFGIALCAGAPAFADQPVPQKANDFTISLPSGSRLQVSSYRGKVVLMQFLYTTCSHCQATARGFSKLESELGAEGLQVVGVAFNAEALADPEVVDNFVVSNDVNFPVGTAQPDQVLGYLGISMMERYVVPQILVIDRKGMIRAKSDALGSAQLQDPAYMRPFLKGLLKEDGTSAVHRKAVHGGKAAQQ